MSLPIHYFVYLLSTEHVPTDLDAALQAVKK